MDVIIILILIIIKFARVTPTSAVLSTDGVTVETWGTPLTVGTSSVSPAVLAMARHIVAFIKDQVRVRVAVAVASLTEITNSHWVAIITWSTPGWDNITHFELFNVYLFTINNENI